MARKISPNTVKARQFLKKIGKPQTHAQIQEATGLHFDKVREALGELHDLKQLEMLPEDTTRTTQSGYRISNILYTIKEVKHD